MTPPLPAPVAHDKGVEQEADKLDADGWDVRAVAHGFPDPDPVAGQTPDIVASKPGNTRIVEVETDPDRNGDRHATFRRHAAQTNRTFYVLVVDDLGRRVEKRD